MELEELRRETQWAMAKVEKIRVIPGESANCLPVPRDKSSSTGAGEVSQDVSGS